MFKRVHANLAGYQAVTVAAIEYSWTGTQSTSTADFRYDFHDLTLSDAAGNADTMYLEDTFTARICYQYTAYTRIENCESGLSTTQKRTYSNGLVEYGYSYSHGGTDLQGETVMMDSPFMYLRSGNHDWNGSTWIFTGSYTFDGGNRFYPRYNGEVSLYMNDASVTGMAISDTGVPQGVNIGYNYYSMNVEMNNTTVTGLATLYGSMSSSWNSNYQLDSFEITNNTFVHFNGYTRLNGAIQWSDECMRVQGGEGNIISDNTFIDCGVGMRGSFLLLLQPRFDRNWSGQHHHHEQRV